MCTPIIGVDNQLTTRLSLEVLVGLLIFSALLKQFLLYEDTTLQCLEVVSEENTAVESPTSLHVHFVEILMRGVRSSQLVSTESILINWIISCCRR